jgi:hypothetical protein
MNMATALRLPAKQARKFLFSLRDMLKKWVKLWSIGN